MSRITFDQSERINTALEQYGSFFTPIGRPINIYKFRKVSGLVRMTNFGEKPLGRNNNEFQQFTDIYTGNAPVVVVWEGSTFLEVLEDKLSILKKVNVGDYYSCHSMGSNINTLETSNISLFNKTYVNNYINREINLTTDDGVPNNKDMTDYLYLILDPVNKGLQGLEIVSAIPIYNVANKEYSHAEISLQTINMKYASTGKSILDFVQFGAIGEGYCFPQEKFLKNGEIEVSLDKEKLFNSENSVYQIQLDFNSGATLDDIQIYGRSKEVVVDDKIMVEAPHLLLPYKMNYPKKSDFLYQTPNLNSYVIMGARPTKNGVWESYKSIAKSNDNIGQYNILNTKQVLVGFNCDEDTVRETNPDMGTYINGDNGKNVIFSQDVTLDAIAYVDPNIKKIDRKVDYCTFLLINSFLNFYTDAFNYEYTETTKYKLTDVLGIFGGIVNTLVGGLDIGGTSARTLAPAQPMNLLCPCISFEDGKSALYKEAPLPVDIFVDNVDSHVIPVSTKVLASGNITLTDRFLDITKIRPSAELGKGLNGIGDTKYIGQTKFEDGTGINEDHSPLLINLQTITPTYPSSTNKRFIIDYLQYRSVSISDVRISAYNLQDEMVYSAFMETGAKARNEITIGSNRIKFNYYDEFNTIGQVSGPKTLEPPKPNPDATGFELTELRNYPAVKLDGNFINLSIADGGSSSLVTSSGSMRVVNPRFSTTHMGPYRIWGVPEDQSITHGKKDNNLNYTTCDISEIDIDMFDKILIELADGTESIYDLLWNEEIDLNIDNKSVIDNEMYINNINVYAYGQWQRPNQVGIYNVIPSLTNYDGKPSGGNTTKLLKATGVLEFVRFICHLNVERTNISISFHTRYSSISMSLNAEPPLNPISTYYKRDDSTPTGINKGGTFLTYIFDEGFIKKVTLLSKTNKRILKTK